MNFAEWENDVPAEIKGDAVWNLKGYRLALFAGDVGWFDVTKLMTDKRTTALSNQLYRALGSMSANIEEGFSRGTGKARARLYEYALGSARDSRGWYYKGRHVLGSEVVDHRIRLITEIIKLLLTMIPDQRSRVVREAGISYNVGSSESDAGEQAIMELLEQVPMP